MHKSDPNAIHKRDYAVRKGGVLLPDKDRRKTDFHGNLPMIDRRGDNAAKR